MKGGVGGGDASLDNGPSGGEKLSCAGNEAIGVGAGGGKRGHLRSTPPEITMYATKTTLLKDVKREVKVAGAGSSCLCRSCFYDAQGTDGDNNNKAFLVGNK